MGLMKLYVCLCVCVCVCVCVWCGYRDYLFETV
jgi:hypothetical protein